MSDLQMITMHYNEEISLKHEITIDGYIRDIESNIFLVNDESFWENIPNVINDLCFKYYHESKDRFDPELHGQCIELIDEMHVKHKLEKGNNNPNVAFVSNIVNPGSGIHEWTFKIGNRANLMYIGVY